MERQLNLWPELKSMQQAQQSCTQRRAAPKQCSVRSHPTSSGCQLSLPFVYDETESDAGGTGSKLSRSGG